MNDTARAKVVFDDPHLHTGPAEAETMRTRPLATYNARSSCSACSSKRLPAGSAASTYSVGQSVATGERRPKASPATIRSRAPVGGSICGSVATG